MSRFFKKLKLKKHKDAIFLLAVIIISALIYSISPGGIFGGYFSGIVSDSVHGVYTVLDYPVKAIGNSYDNYIALLSVNKENKLLRGKLQVLEQEIEKYKFYGTEDKKLRTLLSLKESVKRKVIPARVTFHGIRGWLDSVDIDKGTEDGVKIGDGVISYGGVVGRVIMTSYETSRVIPMTNPSCIFSVIDVETGTMGIARGIGNGFVKMKFVFDYKKVNVGDDIATSGIGRVFPPGITVGKVSSVKKEGYEIFQNIVIAPQKDLFNYKYVLIEK